MQSTTIHGVSFVSVLRALLRRRFCRCICRKYRAPHFAVDWLIELHGFTSDSTQNRSRSVSQVPAPGNHIFAALNFSACILFGCFICYEGAKYCNQYVRLFVCLSVRWNNWKITRLIFAKFLCTFPVVGPFLPELRYVKYCRFWR